MSCRKPHVSSSICLRATIFQNSKGTLWTHCVLARTSITQASGKLQGNILLSTYQLTTVNIAFTACARPLPAGWGSPKLTPIPRRNGRNYSWRARSQQSQYRPKMVKDVDTANHTVHFSKCNGVSISVCHADMH
jgi:hypothetical protein